MTDPKPLSAEELAKHIATLREDIADERRRGYRHCVVHVQSTDLESVLDAVAHQSAEIARLTAPVSEIEGANVTYTLDRMYERSPLSVDGKEAKACADYVRRLLSQLATAVKEVDRWKNVAGIEAGANSLHLAKWQEAEAALATAEAKGEEKMRERAIEKIRAYEYADNPRPEEIDDPSYRYGLSVGKDIASEDIADAIRSLPTGEA